MNGTKPSASTVLKIKEDATSALVNLGYGRKLAADAIERATRTLEFDAPLDAVIKAGLAILKPAPAPLPATGPNPKPMPTVGALKALPGPKLDKPEKSEKSRPEKVGKMETIEIAIDILQACLLCVSKDETRFYLNGVYVHRTPDLFVRAVATDGGRIMVANLYREHSDKPGPKWLSDGVIIPADGLAARLKLISKEIDDGPGAARIAFGENQPRVEISDATGVNVFRVAPINGTYPAYDKIVGNWSGVEIERGDWKPTGQNPKHMQSIAQIAKVLGANSVDCYDYTRTEGGGSQPMLYTFKDNDGVVLFVMSAKAEDKMGTGNRLLLSSSIKGSLAALRAHETRNAEAAKKATGPEKAALLAKVEDFQKRIKAIMESAGSGSVHAALPAPKPPKPVKPAKPAKPKAAPKAAKPKAAQK